MIEFKDDVKIALIDHMGSDASVVAAARVSTQGIESLDSLQSGEGKGLINFLARNRHGTPFEHNSMTFFVSAPIFVYREFHRHRIGWSYNEESGRYKELEPAFYIPNESRPLQQIGKTGNYEFVKGSDEQYSLMSEGHKEVCKLSYENYVRQLEAGIAKEVARITLPVNIYSSMYATCNARSLMSFLGLRTYRENAKFPSKPMREIEMVAEELEAHFKTLFPIIHQAFEENGRVAP